MVSVKSSVTADQNVAKSTTDQDISTNVDISGGSMFVSNSSASEAKLYIKCDIGPTGDKRNCFCIGANVVKFKITLNSALANGDVISADFFNSGSNIALWLSTSSTRPGSAPTASLSHAKAADWTTRTYTVKTGDGICGETTFYIYRGSNTTYFTNFSVTRNSGGGSCSAPSITCSDTGVLTMESATDGASIYYTLDGSTPTSGSTLYNSSSKPSITSTTTVKAIAIKGGLTNSSVSSQSFTMYDVTYNGNGNDSGSAPATAHYVSGSDVIVSGNNNGLGKAQYVFAGWNTSNDASATLSTHYNKDDKYPDIKGNVTFYAVWKHQVAIQVNDEAMGTASATYNTADSYYGKKADNDFVSGSFVSHDVQLTLTATPNPGYHFDTTYKINDVAHPWGNGTGETNNPATVPVGDNKTYTAHFAPNTYTVAFNANRGTGTMVDQAFTYATAQALTTNTYTRSGYTFDGWATSADGEKVYNDGQSVNNLTVTNNGTVTLYAHWAANEYAITLDKGTGGSADGSATATYGSNELSSVTDATKAGSTLLGYYAAADGDKKVANADGTLVKNVAGYTDESGNWTSTSVTTLYAHWEAVAVGTQKFHFVSKKANASINANPEIEITATESSYATTLTGGSLHYYNDGDENYSNGLKFGHNADYLKIDLSPNKLALGDVIICNATKELSFTLTSASSSTAPATTNGKYTITSSDNFAGESIIYVHRKEGTGTSVAEITISAASGDVKTYTIHYDLWGKANTISDATEQTALPATLPTPENVMEGYTFEGWYTDAARTTEAEAGATISAETTLYANYIITAPTMSPASGALTTGDVMTLTSSVSFTNAYMGWSTNSTPLAIGDEGMIHQYSGDARTTMQVTAPAMSGTLYFTWIVSDGTFYSEPTNAGYSIFVPVTEVTLNKTSTSLTIGGTETLTATVKPSSPTSETLVWTTGDPTVATVSSTGVVTAVGVGTATIAAVATQGTDDPSDDITSVGCVVRVTSGGGASSGLFSVNFSGSDVWTSGDGSVWSSSSDNDDLAAVSGNTVLHDVTFRNSSTGGFSIDGSGENQVLKFADNASTTRWFAIPVSGIEGGRIDVYIKTKYANNSGFKFKMYFDTAHGTTVQTSSGTLSVPTFDYVDGYEGKAGVFHFRIKDLLVKSGVLYMGPSSSSFREIQAVKITTSETNFTASPSSVTIGDDTTQPVQVTILNNTAFVPTIKTAPNEAVATALYNRSDGVLDITPVAAGSTNVVMALDENMNGQWDEGENTTINIPITVNTISVTGQPASAVYATGDNADNLSVTASVASGTLRYQWYKNTVNSTVGGVAISGATGKTYKPSTSATEEAAFYYCELTADGYQSKYSDVAYILTSSTYRYFHMSNVAGNRQTSDASELITGEVIAGGTATAIRGTGDYYRYITRPATSNPHMYVVKNADKYIKVKLDNKIGTNDLITVRLMGNKGTAGGIKIATDASGANAITILQDVTSEKVYQTVFTSAFNNEDEIYILGIYPGEQNYFTDLYISEAEALKVSAPTPATINTQVGETAPSLSIIASGGAGSYTYQWYWNESNNTTSGTSIGGATSASYTPPTTASGTTYYYCKVTSGGDTKTSTTAKVVVAAVAHGWYNPSYNAAGVNQYVLNSSNYEGQNAETATLKTNYWKNDTKVAFKSTTISTVNASADNYPKVSGNSNQKYLTFYVKNAVEFSLVGTSSKKTVNVIVNGKTVKSGLVINNTESEKFALRKTDGDTITINNASGDVYLGRLTFYEKVSPTISVEKDGEVVSEATQYLGDDDVSYEIISNSTGAVSVTNSDDTKATVSYDSGTGVMTVSPVAEGTTTITINQAGDSNYSTGSTTFKVTVQKHVLSLAFSYNEASFGGSRLVANDDIASEKLPTLSVLLDGKVLTDSEISAKGINVKYKSDDTSIADFDDETDYTVTYKGGQGAARIYAYVDARTNISSAKTYFDLSVTNGTNNKLSNGEAISPQQSYMVKNSDGVELVRVIYGGFKYGGEGNNKHQYSYGGNTVTDKWSSAAAHTASLDGFKYFTKNGDNDAMNEYFHNIYSSMTEEYEDNKGYKHDMREIWYQEDEVKPDGDRYRPFERVKPFALPCRADYLKFEPMKSGKLTVYVIQNGVLGISKNSTQLGTRPRVGYWFDQDGWRIDPIVPPVSKHVLGADQGRNNNTYGGQTYEQQMTKWNSNTHGDIIKLLTKEYCSVADPTTETPVSAFNNTEDGTYKYANPYVWPTNSVVNENRNKIIPTPMKPVPYHGGYMMFQEAFVKYTINVVAGKTYYFTGSSTKVGYVGLNFVEDESVLTSKGIAHEENTLHLTADDKMNEYKFGGSNEPLTQSTLYDEVTLPSNYKDNQWSAICLPFALSEKQVEEAFGYGTELTLYNGLIKKGTDYTVKFLTHVDQNILPGQPYFIRPTGVDKDGNPLPHVGTVIGSDATGGTGTRITFNTVLIDINNLKQACASYGSNADVDVDGVETGKESYVFTGSYAPVVPLTKYSYIMNAGILRRYTGSTLRFPTYMAYIAPESDNAQNGSISFHADFEDNVIERTWIDDENDAPTSVITIEEIADAMNAAERKNSDKTYNVMGQQIDPRSAKGLVIKNGKKYIFE